MPPSSGALAVVIDQPRAPFAADRGIVAARDQARVLDRDHRLVIVAVERPGLDLALGALSAVQELVERMQAVIAPRADVAQRRFQFVGRQQRHSAISMPSNATSQPAASTRRRSGEPSTRIGLVLLMCTKIFRAESPCKRRERSALAVDRHVAHAAAGFRPGAGADHLVIGEQRAVEQDDVGARQPLRAAKASSRQRREHRRGACCRPKFRRRHWRRFPPRFRGFSPSR